jgi:hypothetical protein
MGRSQSLFAIRECLTICKQDVVGGWNVLKCQWNHEDKLKVCAWFFQARLGVSNSALLWKRRVNCRQKVYIKSGREKQKHRKRVAQLVTKSLNCHVIIPLVWFENFYSFKMVVFNPEQNINIYDWVLFSQWSPNLKQNWNVAVRFNCL